MLTTINGSETGKAWWVCTFYFGGHSHIEQTTAASGIKEGMAKIFELHHPSPKAFLASAEGTVAIRGLFFDVAIEPANEDGRPHLGWDVSIACDDPRGYFEERRDTINGAADFVKDCVGLLILEKFPELVPKTEAQATLVVAESEA